MPSFPPRFPDTRTSCRANQAACPNPGQAVERDIVAALSWTLNPPTSPDSSVILSSYVLPACTTPRTLYPLMSVWAWNGWLTSTLLLPPWLDILPEPKDLKWWHNKSAQLTSSESSDRRLESIRKQPMMLYGQEKQCWPVQTLLRPQKKKKHATCKTIG